MKRLLKGRGGCSRVTVLPTAAGVSKGAPEGGNGFVSQRAPVVVTSGTAVGHGLTSAIPMANPYCSCRLTVEELQTAFQPFAIVIPFVNGTVPPLPEGFKGQTRVLPTVPGGESRAVGLS